MAEQKKVIQSDFVRTMLTSAEERKEVKPQTRHDLVNQEELDLVMANIKKGVVRR